MIIDIRTLVGNIQKYAEIKKHEEYTTIVFHKNTAMTNNIGEFVLSERVERYITWMSFNYVKDELKKDDSCRMTDEMVIHFASYDSFNDFNSRIWEGENNLLRYISNETEKKIIPNAVKITSENVYEIVTNVLLELRHIESDKRVLLVSDDVYTLLSMHPLFDHLSRIINITDKRKSLIIGTKKDNIKFLHNGKTEIMRTSDMVSVNILWAVTYEDGSLFVTYNL